MKKISTFIFVFMIVVKGFSQHVYNSWDFTTITSSNLPAGFITYDLDGQTVNTTYLNSSFNTAGWIQLPAGGGYIGLAATGTLFNNQNATSNRWLVTPDLYIPAGVPTVALQWTALSLDGNYPDNYLIEVSTTDSNTTSFTTTLTTISQESGSPTTHVLPLAAYAGQTIRIAFRDSTQGGFGLALENLSLISLPTADLSVYDVEIYEHNYLGSSVTVTGLFANNGFDTINTYTQNYSVNGGTPVSEPATNAGITPQLGVVSPYQYYYNFNTPFTPTAAGTDTIQVWFSGLNGGGNSDTNSVIVFFYPQASGLVKNVLVEEMTGAGCPFCPGGALELRDVHNALSYVIPVAIHSGDIDDLGDPSDSMQINDGETICNNYCTGFPEAMIDRLYAFDNFTTSIGVGNPGSPSQYAGLYTGPGDVATYNWDTLSVFRKIQATPVNVSLSAVTYDSATMTISANVNATFLNSLSQGTYNLNLYVVEDSLIHPGQAFDQDNSIYSSAGGQLSSSINELWNLPTVLINNGQVNEYSQNHVLRTMVGGPWGTAGQIPSNPAQGSTYSYTFTTTADPSWRLGYLKLVGLVQEYNANNLNLRTVLNAAETSLISSPNGIKPIAALNSLSVYPNPASTMAEVEMSLKQDATVTISVLDAMGQVTIQPADNLLNAGSHTVNIPVSGLSTGLYFVKISVNGEVSTVPLSVTTK
jgi:hypothetical protein